jgi:hypothetical protein
LVLFADYLAGKSLALWWSILEDFAIVSTAIVVVIRASRLTKCDEKKTNWKKCKENAARRKQFHEYLLRGYLKQRLSDGTCSKVGSEAVVPLFC